MKRFENHMGNANIVCMASLQCTHSLLVVVLKYVPTGGYPPIYPYIRMFMCLLEWVRVVLGVDAPEKESTNVQLSAIHKDYVETRDSTTTVTTSRCSWSGLVSYDFGKGNSQHQWIAEFVAMFWIAIEIIWKVKLSKFAVKVIVVVVPSLSKW